MNSGMPANPPRVSPPVAVKTLVWVSLIACCGLLVLLWRGHYSARQRVEGYLSDVESVLPVHAGREGTITRMLVRPGQWVRKHQALFTISGEQVTSDGSSLLSSQMRVLEKQQQSVEQRARLDRAAWISKKQSLESSAQSAGRQLDTLARQQELQRALISRRTLNARRANRLLEQGHIARATAEEASERQLEAELVLQELLDRGEALANHGRQLWAQLESEQARMDAEQLRLNEITLQLQAELGRLRARWESLTQAPRAGFVGDVRAGVGRSVTAGDTVVTLHSGLEPVVADLAVPTRLMPVLSQSLGIRIEIEDSLDPGGGPLDASILEVSSTPLAAGDLFGPMLLRQAAYKVRVAISPHSLEAVHRGLLLPNRHVTALLIGPPRPLLHWILQPLRELASAVS
jgi:multidrug efflux pump subunit AcrA (membrane-fusion protein)